MMIIVELVSLINFDRFWQAPDSGSMLVSYAGYTFWLSHDETKGKVAVVCPTEYVNGVDY